uniref:Uncharacterized protein n=1 Tax=Tanacetum cinerariifolium TaxID=118510 RepID=A0A699Q893_TANCI|nr:hypothetical protein [Tanacetum cinerariifolium]
MPLSLTRRLSTPLPPLSYYALVTPHHYATAVTTAGTTSRLHHAPPPATPPKPPPPSLPHLYRRHHHGSNNKGPFGLFYCHTAKKGVFVGGYGLLFTGGVSFGSGQQQ